MKPAPLFAPYVDLPAQNRPLREALLAAVARVLEHGQLILGPEVEALEERVAGYLGVPHVVGVGSGTDALVLALRARGIGAGHEVITTAHGFVATASAIALCGATPVFADIDRETMLLDPAAVARAITPRTRAVIPVHLAGHPCDLDALEELCARRSLLLLEDCAQAFGVRFRGRGVATAPGSVGCFSLHPLKVLAACGDAGFITTHDADERDHLRRLRNLGLRDRDTCVEVSDNRRLHAIQAAMIAVKLDHVDAYIAARQARAARYRAALAGRVTLPPADDEHRVIYSAFVIRHPRRDALRSALLQRGVDGKIHYPIPIHRQPAFAAPERPPLPITDEVVDQILSLPIAPEMSFETQTRVIAALEEALEELA